MAELNQKKASKPVKTATPKSMAQIPFAISTLKSLSLSPAHKRKLSPVSKSAFQINGDENTSQRNAKKRYESQQLTDLSNQQETLVVSIKSEPICLDDDNDIDDMTLINSLASVTSKDIKKECLNQDRRAT